MEIFKNLSDMVTSARKTISDKSRKNSAISRLKAIIKKEEANCESAYIALGKYYYHTLRDKNDIVAEPKCTILDNSRERIEKAAKKLEAFYNDEPEKAEEIKEEIKEYFYEEEPSFKAYVYLRDEDEEAIVNNIDYVPSEAMLDESVEQHSKIKPEENSEENDELLLPFE